MKFKVLDQPERDINPTKMVCCAYSLFSWSVVSLLPEPKKVRAKLAKGAKIGDSAKRSASAKRKTKAA